MNDELNQRQERFLKAMLSTASIDEACKVAGINRNTGYKYLKDERFMRVYRKLRREAMQQVTARLQKVSEQAVQTLQEVMVDQESTPSSRVQAAKNVLDVAYRSLDIDDTQARVEAIESRLENESQAIN